MKIVFFNKMSTTFDWIDGFFKILKLRESLSFCEIVPVSAMVIAEITLSAMGQLLKEHLAWNSINVN